MTLEDYFQEAEDFYQKEDYVAASKIYLSLREYEVVAPFSDYRLATIANNFGDPSTAYDLYYSSFYGKPDIVASLYGPNHPNRNYIFKGKSEELEIKNCAICGTSNVQPKWCYVLVETGGYNELINPVRLWMYCERCHHVFARHFPEKLPFFNNSSRKTNISHCKYYSLILNRISQFAIGKTLLEVGIGASECMLTAQEMGYDTFGIDVIDRHVLVARERFGLQVETVDFLVFATEKKFDVIIMGDVIEHVSDPVLAIRKAYDLLNDNGAIWVSTPNFDSAYSIVNGHNDVMRRQQYHLNYFSRKSFYRVLDHCGFAPVAYDISDRYSGSMEIIAIKKSRMGTH